MIDVSRVSHLGRQVSAINLAAVYKWALEKKLAPEKKNSRQEKKGRARKKNSRAKGKKVFARIKKGYIP